LGEKRSDTLERKVVTHVPHVEFPAHFDAVPGRTDGPVVEMGILVEQSGKAARTRSLTGAL
jgi:hypothetical protein